MASLVFKLPRPTPAPPSAEEAREVFAHAMAAGGDVAVAVLRMLAAVTLAVGLADAASGGLPAARAVVYVAIVAVALGASVAGLRGRVATRATIAVLALALVALGALLGLDPGPRSLAWLFLVGPFSAALFLPILPRIVVASSLPAVGLAAYFGVGGEAAFASPQLAVQVSFLAFTVAMGVTTGHFVYWVSTEGALQRVRLAARREDVAGLHRELARRVGAQRDELQALAEHLREARDRERGTLGDQIRAELAPELDALRRHLEELACADDDGAASGRLDEAERTMESVHATFRRLLHRLHPVVLEQLGLTEAIRWLADDAGRRRGVPVRLTVDVGAEPRPERVDRLAFEAVRAALRRSEAAGVEASWSVDVGRTSTGLRVEVVDDGPRARDTTPTVLFVGLREHIAAEGGAVSCRPEPSGGSRLVASIPRRAAW